MAVSGWRLPESIYRQVVRLFWGGANIIKLEACVKELQSDRVKPLILNLNEVDSFDKKIEQAEEMFGGIDIFVNAAGVHTENVDFWSVTSDEYDRVMNINLKGAYFFCRELAKYWVKKQKRGHILLISSVRGSEPAWSPYGISKWGLNGMTIGLAKMLTSQGIIVNAIAPGSTATPLIGINQGDSIYTEDNSSKRMLMPEEIGEYARLLVSDAGDTYIKRSRHLGYTITNSNFLQGINGARPREQILKKLPQSQILWDSGLRT